MFSFFFHDIKGGVGGNAAARLWLGVPAFQVSFYENK